MPSSILDGRDARRDALMTALGQDDALRGRSVGPDVGSAPLLGGGHPQPGGEVGLPAVPGGRVQLPGDRGEDSFGDVDSADSPVQPTRAYPLMRPPTVPTGALSPAMDTAASAVEKNMRRPPQETLTTPPGGEFHWPPAGTATWPLTLCVPPRGTGQPRPGESQHLRPGLLLTATAVHTVGQ